MKKNVRFVFLNKGISNDIFLKLFPRPHIWNIKTNFIVNSNKVSNSTQLRQSFDIKIEMDFKKK
jgi:hypothetical protein